MLNDAVEQGVEESDQLDWKAERPSEADLARSDRVKDIAAFANSGGGVLVFDFAEEQRKAARRVDVGEVTEGYERTLRRVAVSGIHPPVFNLGVQEIGGVGCRALVVVVPPSVEVPHLIYRNDYFGAPIRNHADTEWMRERQLEAMYRQRLDERRNSDRAIDDLYDEVAAGRDTIARAWLIGVAYPRIPLTGRSLDREEMRTVVRSTVTTVLEWVKNLGHHPLESVERLNPVRGLRRWVLRNQAEGTRNWREAWMAVHDNGAVSLAAAAGGRRAAQGETLPGNAVTSFFIECAISDLLALLWQSVKATGISAEYDVVVGIEWTGTEPLIIETMDNHGFRFVDNSIPLARYTPVRTSVRLDVDELTFLGQVYELARDAINQGGVQNVQMIPPPPEE
jgi:hypothetical protein